MTIKGEKVVEQEKPAEKPIPILIPSVSQILPMTQATISSPAVEEAVPPVVPPILIPVPALSDIMVLYRLEPAVEVEVVLPSASFTITGAHFKTGKAQLTPKGKKDVAAHALFLKQNPNLSITVEGHTDKRGSEGYNYKLGMKRAQAVWKELKKGGVQNGMGVVSYGEGRPIDPAKTKSAYGKNRRAEIRVDGGKIQGVGQEMGR